MRYETPTQPAWKTPTSYLLVLLVGLLLQACGSLPHQDQRKPSYAIAPNPQSSLVQLMQSAQRTQSASAKNAQQHATGFLLLDTANSAYAARLALIQQATHTLDIQYYAIHNDPSTKTLLQAIRHAAKRGVRVRILIDDFNSSGKHAQVFRLGFLPNIEMRIFNPIAGGRALASLRPVLALRGFARLQQRMHNKLLLADNAAGILGGRNLSESYFGQSHSSNFVDLDVLALGALVQPMSASFDAYWNHPLAYPVRNLIDLTKLKHLKDTVAAAPVDTQHIHQLPPPLDLAKTQWIWAQAEFWVDDPAKFTPAKRKPSLPNSTVYKMVDLLETAQHEVLLVSAYLVPDQHMVDALKRLHQRGIKVRVLTNSLASNDAPAAHIGYARWRERLVDTGIELYEMRAVSTKRLRDVFGSSGNASHRSLHVKAAIIDQKTLLVGSMNLDQRSHLYNSEVAVLMHSPVLAQALTHTLEPLLKKDVWQVVRSPKGTLQWKSLDPKHTHHNHPEPNANVSLQLLIKLIAPFIRTRWL